ALFARLTKTQLQQSEIRNQKSRCQRSVYLTFSAGPEIPVRLVCELILIVGLIALGWQKSFKQWTDDWRGMRQPKTMPVHQTTAVNTTSVPRQPFVNAGYTRNAPPRAQPTVSNGDWMWDPSHRTVL